MPKSGYRDSGYYVRLENNWCAVVFQSESGYLENISVIAKDDESIGEFVSHWAFLTTGEEVKHIQSAYTAENIFDHYADFSIPYLREMLKLIQTPALFNERLAELEAADSSKKITVDMIRTERARLHSLGLDSSLGAAMANLRKGNKDE